MKSTTVNKERITVNHRELISQGESVVVGDKDLCKIEALHFKEEVVSIPNPYSVGLLDRYIAGYKTSPVIADWIIKNL